MARTSTTAGYLDFVLGNGSPRMERVEPLMLIENDGGRFRDVTFSAGLPYRGQVPRHECWPICSETAAMTILVASRGRLSGGLDDGRRLTSPRSGPAIT